MTIKKNHWDDQDHSKDHDEADLSYTVQKPEMTRRSKRWTKRNKRVAEQATGHQNLNWSNVEQPRRNSESVLSEIPASKSICTKKKKSSASLKHFLVSIIYMNA